MALDGCCSLTFRNHRIGGYSGPIRLYTSLFPPPAPPAELVCFLFVAGSLFMAVLLQDPCSAVGFWFMVYGRAFAGSFPFSVLTKTEWAPCALSKRSEGIYQVGTLIKRPEGDIMSECVPQILSNGSGWIHLVKSEILILSRSQQWTH